MAIQLAVPETLFCEVKRCEYNSLGIKGLNENVVADLAEMLPPVTFVLARRALSSKVQIRRCGSFYQNFFSAFHPERLLSLSLPLSFSSLSYFFLSPSQKDVFHSLFPFFSSITRETEKCLFCFFVQRQNVTLAGKPTAWRAISSLMIQSRTMAQD